MKRYKLAKLCKNPKTLQKPNHQTNQRPNIKTTAHSIQKHRKRNSIQKPPKPKNHQKPSQPQKWQTHKKQPPKNNYTTNTTDTTYKIQKTIYYTLSNHLKTFTSELLQKQRTKNIYLLFCCNFRGKKKGTKAESPQPFHCVNDIFDERVFQLSLWRFGWRRRGSNPLRRWIIVIGYIRAHHSKKQNGV